jgi:uncharacterized membrane protein YobD (UPF0266 family)
MKVNSSDFTLRKLLLNSIILDNFEYCYFCPLLKEIGSYLGNTDVILTAHKLSQQAQYISDLKKKIENIVKNTHFYIKNSTIQYSTDLNVLNTRIEDFNYATTLIERDTHLSVEQYLLLMYVFLGEYCSEFVKPAKKIRFDLLNQSSFDESIFICLIFILIYKIWKIEYCYISISKLAFDSQELKIAQYFIQIARLESKMISILIKLFKHLFQTNILLILKYSLEQKKIETISLYS